MAGQGAVGHVQDLQLRQHLGPLRLWAAAGSQVAAEGLQGCGRQLAAALQLDCAQVGAGGEQGPDVLQQQCCMGAAWQTLQLERCRLGRL